MAEFIELTEHNDKKLLINADHIIKVLQDDEGCFIYFDVTTSSGNSSSLSLVHIAESYAVVKKKLQ